MHRMIHRSSCSAGILSRHENFKDVVDNETTLKPSVSPVHLMQKYVIFYRSRTWRIPDYNRVTKTDSTGTHHSCEATLSVISEEYIHLEMGLFAEELNNYEDDIQKYSDNSFLLKIEPEDAVKSRLSTLEEAVVGRDVEMDCNS